MEKNIRRLGTVFVILFMALSWGLVWWQVIQAESLNRDPNNPRVIEANRNRLRGNIYDRRGKILASSQMTEHGAKRVYYDQTLVHTIGYASFADKYGVAGLEKTYNDYLLGLRQVDFWTEWKNKLLSITPESEELVLTIDEELQAKVAQILGESRGAIVVLNPKNGEILASVSVPYYDPNQLTDPATQDSYWASLQQAGDFPLLNRATQGLYPPGSTFKILTAAAGIDSGTFSEKTRLEINDPWQPNSSWGDYYVRCSSHFRGVTFEMNEAMAKSCNIYFAQVALRVGQDKLREYAHRFGIGDKIPLEIDTAPTQMANSDKPMSEILLADTGYGQGELLLSPLQMALIASAPANQGLIMKPHLVSQVRSKDGSQVLTTQPGELSRPISTETAAKPNELLVYAVNGPGAFAYTAAVPGVTVAGKTGTAETPSGEPHSWFVGYAPADDPQFVVAVIVENAGAGAAQAAPMARSVFEAALGK